MRIRSDSDRDHISGDTAAHVQKRMIITSCGMPINAPLPCHCCFICRPRSHQREQGTIIKNRLELYCATGTPHDNRHWSRSISTASAAERMVQVMDEHLREGLPYRV